MADVNFLFPAPMRPQSVMMFRLVFQLAGAIVASLYMLGQIPNLVINVGLGGLAISALFIGWIMLLFLTRIFSVFTYTNPRIHEQDRFHRRTALKPETTQRPGVVSGITG
mgnify:CR=1 FL=1